jgi:hypothetical protein
VGSWLNSGTSCGTWREGILGGEIMMNLVGRKYSKNSRMVMTFLSIS